MEKIDMAPMKITYDKDFNDVDILNKYCKQDEYLWDALGLNDIDEDNDGDPTGSFECWTNVSINGELWEFKIEITESEPAIDYSCYGSYITTEVKLFDKQKLN